MFVGSPLYLCLCDGLYLPLYAMTLVFPTSKPLGANNRNSREAIKDSAAFPTRVIDYLKLDIYDHNDNSIIETLYLYLPTKLAESYTAQYKGVKLGPAGVQGVAAAKEISASGGDLGGKGISTKIKKFAEAAKPSLAFNAGAKVLGAAVGVTGQGNPGLTGNDLSALVQNKVFNPYEEAIFQGTDFRSHQFNFKMQPKSKEDVYTIYQIINTLRTAMLPGKDGNNWLTIPEYFRIGIVRYTDDGKDETVSHPGYSGGGGMLNALMQFPTKLVLQGCTVDLAPDGNYSSLQSWSPGNQFTDFGPSSYNLSLQFQETAYLTKESFGASSSSNSGYYNYNSLMGPDSVVAPMIPPAVPGAPRTDNQRNRRNTNYNRNRRRWRRGGPRNVSTR